MRIRILYITSVIFLLALCSLNSQVPESAPVIFKGDTLFSISNNLGPFSSTQRATLVQKNIRQLSKLPLTEFDSIKIITSNAGVNIEYRKKVIVTITEIDALSLGISGKDLAKQYEQTIKSALISDYNDTSLKKIFEDFGLFFLSLFIFLIFWKIVNSLFDFLRKNLKELQRNIFFRNNRIIKLFSLVTPETERNILLFFLRMLRFLALGFFLYFYLPFMFSQISYTRGFGEKLMGYVLQPLLFLSNGILGFLPNFLFIIVIIFAVRYLINGLAYVANQVRMGKVTVSGFFPDWATPTFNLFRVLIIIFTLVIIFPYLPGAGSDAFQGVSVFIGLLLSLGSAGAISNIISGVILTYMRPFQIGDRVKINEITGDIIRKNLLVTKLRTTKNEEITIPNATLLNGGMVNYTSLAEKQGLIINTTITIGYDVPWIKVHELLTKAALATDLIEKNPKPFVLQKSLDDWYVAYEINAFTKKSHEVPRIYSQLHSKIQDIFNEEGVEIMSSHYLAVRDGNQMAVPKEYFPENYKKDSFNIKKEE